jgi:Zn-dependent protease
MNFDNFDPIRFVISMLVLIVSVTFHELAHALSAKVAGDDTAQRAGRISLNPLDHLDPMGTVMMVVSSLSGQGIGWAKPVPVNPMKFRHPRWDNLKVALWGPLSNFIIAFLVCQLFRFGVRLEGTDYTIAAEFILINISLGLFNLIPIHPLDGSHIMSALLPTDLARRYDIFMGRYGFIILLVLIFAAPEVLGYTLAPAAKFLLKLFIGV